MKFRKLLIAFLGKGSIAKEFTCIVQALQQSAICLVHHYVPAGLDGTSLIPSSSVTDN